jgi:hypothetical protein
MTMSRDKRSRPREGFALPVALGSMVVIGMILAGVFFAATQENRVGRNTINQEKAFRAAEFGVNNTYGSWSNSTMNALAVGGVATIVHDSSAKGWIDTVRVTRLNNNSYWLVSTAYAGSGLAQSRHRTTSAIRIGFPQINFLAALTVHGKIKIGGSSLTTGVDTPPPGWACPPAGTTQPGIATDDSTAVNFTSCNNMTCVIGSPKIQQNPAVADTNTFFTYGPDANWATLTSAATLTFNGSWTLTNLAPAYTAAGDCNTAVMTNWGDPNRASPAGKCEGYFPIIYFGGTGSTVHISGGTGQGILLIDGDLLVDGGFQWFGPVIARGHVTTQGTGGHFNGGVMAADVDLEQNTVLGNAIIDYSKCAIDAALVGAGIPKRLKQRSWADMF